MLLGGGSSCQACGCSPGCPEPDFTPVSYDTASGGTWLAQSFIAPAGGLTLTSATLSIAGYVPLGSTFPPGSYTNYPRSKIYANENGTGSDSGKVRPEATALATLTAPAVGLLGDPTWTFTHAGYSLTGGVRYWISLETNGEWQYYQSYEPPNPPFDLCYGLGLSFTTTSGAVWVFSDQTFATPYLLTIN